MLTDRLLSDFATGAGEFLKNLFSFDQAHPLIFTQFYFWVFFAFVLAGLCVFRNRMLLRNAFLFFTSLFFYYRTSGLFLILLVTVVVLTYSMAFAIRRSRSRGGRRFFLFVSVAANLSLLCYYKYAYFFVNMLNDLLGTSFQVRDVIAQVGNAVMGYSAFSVDSIILPVGISFFIFQAVSYLVDVSRERIEPVGNILDFGFYLCFFPQLVAGPIVRATDFVPQLRRPFCLSRMQFGMAVFWILNGLGKKLILSDFVAAHLCDMVFANPSMYTGFENLAALFGYSLQIYADFSGYTDIAIGVAMLMGFFLPKNFNSPYKAQSAGEFWKRWHISLSKWLQDYLYIPLGGNRKGTVMSFAIPLGIGCIAAGLSRSWWVAGAVAAVTALFALCLLVFRKSRRELVSDINRMDTMLLGGLWHGASWNFMIWGGLNGLGMMVSRLWAKFNEYVRFGVLAVLCAVLWFLRMRFGLAVFNLFFIWSAVLAAGALVALLFRLFGGPSSPGDSSFRTRLAGLWASVQTFVFITFTWLFFRSGSNANPSEANERAWNTAKAMIERIGGEWDFSLLPFMVKHHAAALLAIAAGLAIHWLPDNFKRRYRIWFARMPLPLMVLVCAIIVFIICQFVQSDLQTFIYFQF